MNYFQFYNIPVSFYPDEKLLKQRFYAFSKEYHPDFHANESAEKQAEILELSTLNNKAYQTLSSVDKRLNHILELYGMLEENEKYALPQSFLMEMMEINESLMEMEMEPEQGRLTELMESIKQYDNSLEDELKSQTIGFEGLSEEGIKDCLRQVKDIYYRKKYLLRIKDSLNKFAAK